MLESGKIYRLDLSLYQPSPEKGSNEESKLVPLVDKSYFAYQPSKIEVHHLYDKESLELVPIRINQDTFTKITLRYQGPAMAPKISLVLKLTYPRLRFKLAFIFLIVAQIMIAAPNLTNILTSQQPTNIKIGTTAFWLIGSAINSIVLFALFNILPGAPSA